MKLSTQAKEALDHIKQGDALVKEAKVLRDRAANAPLMEMKAEQHYKAAGKIYAKIKADHKSKDGAWAKACQAKCGLSRRRVDELIELASGRVSLAEQREQKAASVQKSRAAQKQALHSSRSARSGGCHVDHEIGEGASPAEIRRSAAEWQANEAIRLATEFKMLKADTPELDNTVLALVHRAASAWTDLEVELKRRAEQRESTKPEPAPFTAAMEASLTKSIQKRRLPHGACSFDWVGYFLHRMAHDCAPLTDADLRYLAGYTPLPQRLRARALADQRRSQRRAKRVRLQA